MEKRMPTDWTPADLAHMEHLKDTLSAECVHAEAFDRIPSDEEMREIESRLCHKYGIEER